MLLEAIEFLFSFNVKENENVSGSIMFHTLQPCGV